jgi:MFS family permease
MKNFEIIKEAAIKFYKNPVLGFPSLLQIVANYVPVLLFILGIVAVSGISIASLMVDPTAITSKAFSDALLLIIIFGIIMMIALIAINAFFDGMIIGMINSTKIKIEFDPGRKFFSRLFGFDLIFGIYMLIAVAILVGLAVLSVKVSMPLLIIPLLLLVVFLFSLPLFALTSYYIVINNLHVKDALKKSFKIVRKNYLKILGIFILLMLIGIVVYIILDFIPVIGGILANLLMMTYMKICMWMFALGKA